MDERPTAAIRRTIDAVAEDEGRRSKILKKLENAIKLYLESCSRERDVEWDRVIELLGAACRGFYDSLATSYLAVEPPIDPTHLFGLKGELFGGRTLVEFEKAVKAIKIRTPNRWPPPQMGREGDSPQLFRAFNRLSKSLHRDVRLGLLLEGGWLSDWVSAGVKHWRPQFERRFASLKKAPMGADRPARMSNPFRDGFTDGNPYTQTDEERERSLMEAKIGRKYLELIDREPTAGGRPRELIAIDSAKVKRLRGKRSKATFARRCGISEDTLDRAERNGMASVRTIDAICGFANGQGIKLTPDDLKRNQPQ
jgi:hypothetical protein